MDYNLRRNLTDAIIHVANIDGKSVLSILKQAGLEKKCIAFSAI